MPSPAVSKSPASNAAVANSAGTKPSAPGAGSSDRPAPFLPDDDFAPIDAADRPLAYSATTTSDTPEDAVSTRARSDAARSATRAASTTTPGTGPRTATSRLAIWAMVLSILGITSPIGLILGYRARSTIKRTRDHGSSFAKVAIWIGWLYIAVFVFALIVYFWIGGQA